MGACRPWKLSTSGWRAISGSVFSILCGVRPTISIGLVRVIMYSAFLRELALPAHLNIVQLKPLRGSSLFIFESALVFAVVESLFGGNGKVHTRIEGREFSMTEQRIVRRLLDLVLTEYARAWEPVYQLTAEYVRSEMQPQFTNIATPSEVVVVSKLDIDLGGVGGAIHMVVPYSSLEPIRDILVSGSQADSGHGDKRWLGMLSHQVQSAEVELVATLATANATLKQVLNMRPGDVIALDLPERIMAGVDGIPLFECKSGIAKGRYAMRIEQVLNNTPGFKVAGDAHAS